MVKLKETQTYKDKVIYNLLMYLEIPNTRFKIKATENLREIARHYNITLKKQPSKHSLKKCLMDFVINDKGYNITLINLYNSL